MKLSCVEMLALTYLAERRESLHFIFDIRRATGRRVTYSTMEALRRQGFVHGFAGDRKMGPRWMATDAGCAEVQR